LKLKFNLIEVNILCEKHALTLVMCNKTYAISIAKKRSSVQKIDKKLILTLNFMTIKFVTDGRNNSKGFLAEYIALDKSKLL
jgi:hypothetical protein